MVMSRREGARARGSCTLHLEVEIILLIKKRVFCYWSNTDFMLPD